MKFFFFYFFYFFCGRLDTDANEVRRGRRKEACVNIYTQVSIFVCRYIYLYILIDNALCRSVDLISVYREKMITWHVLSSAGVDGLKPDKNCVELIMYAIRQL